MNINFFTANYPYTKSEAFIENEIPILASKVGLIRTFPFDIPENAILRDIPDNAELIDARPKSQIKLGFKDYRSIFKILSMELWLANKKGFFLKKLRTHTALLKKAMQYARYLEEMELVHKNELYYSYWMNDWATVLLILKVEKKIDHFIFRCGGFDIWDERHEGNYLPFRGVIYKYTSGVYPNSYKAEVYLRAKKLYPEKISHQYWGTADHGLAPFDSESPFTIVSCSNVIPLKRVNLIIDILEKVNKKVHWVHFGDGSEYETIREYANKIEEKHQVDFRGNVKNHEIYEFYKSNTVNLFITTSSTEGLPVSIQEAISFGIPIIATDVGGMKEVVTPETGILISPNVNIEETAQIIENFEASSQNTKAFRTGIRQFWLKLFDSKTTYKNFFELISNLMSK